MPTKLRQASGCGFEARLRNGSPTNSPAHTGSRSVSEPFETV